MEPHFCLLCSAKYAHHITIPEDLDYTDVFDPILKDVKLEKALIDELRVRNGNLEISISRQEVVTGEL